MTGDDLMDEAIPGKNGTFHLKGTERELSYIDPIVRIHHNCTGVSERFVRKEITGLRADCEYLLATGLHH